MIITDIEMVPGKNIAHVGLFSGRTTRARHIEGISGMCRLFATSLSGMDGR